MDLRKLKTLIDLVQNSGISDLKSVRAKKRCVPSILPQHRTTNIHACSRSSGAAAVASANSCRRRTAPARGHVMKAPLGTTSGQCPMPRLSSRSARR